jgi:hypothetical protein
MRKLCGRALASARNIGGVEEKTIDDDDFDSEGSRGLRLGAEP